MKITYDAATDTLTVVLRDAPARISAEEKSGVILDYDAEGRLIALDGGDDQEPDGLSSPPRGEGWARLVVEVKQAYDSADRGLAQCCCARSALLQRFGLAVELFGDGVFGGGSAERAAAAASGASVPNGLVQALDALSGGGTPGEEPSVPPSVDPSGYRPLLQLRKNEMDLLRKRLLSLVVLVPLAALIGGCDDGPAEDVGEAVDDAAEEAGDAAEDATD